MLCGKQHLQGLVYLSFGFLLERESGDIISIIWHKLNLSNFIFVSKYSHPLGIGQQRCDSEI